MGRRLADVPLTERRSVSFTAVGDDRLVLFGGTEQKGRTVTPLTDGAIWSFARREWRALPAWPLDLPVHRATLASDGATLAAIGRLCRPVAPGRDDFEEACRPNVLGGAALDLATGTWRALPNLPARTGAGPGGHVLAQVATIAVRDGAIDVAVQFGSQPDLAFYRLPTGASRWEGIAGPPVPARAVCEAGGRIAVVDHIAGPGPAGTAVPSPTVSVLGSSGRWSAPAEAPPAARPKQVAVVCAGSTVHLFMLKGPLEKPVPETSAYDTGTGAWSTEPNLGPLLQAHPIATGADGTVAVVAGRTASALPPGAARVETEALTVGFDGARLVLVGDRLTGIWDDGDLQVRAERLKD